MAQKMCKQARLHYRRGASAFWLQIGGKSVCETTAGRFFLVAVSKYLLQMFTKRAIM
jgi:hypothetical protein